MLVGPLSVPSQERGRWDDFVASHPHGHLLQSYAWGELRAAFGWEVVRLAMLDGENIRGAAQVLFRRMLAFSVAYVPRGPLVDWEDERALRALLQGVTEACRRRRAILLKIEPYLPDEPRYHAALAALGFRPAKPVQPRSTLVADLTVGETELLARLRKNTRYSIRLAERMGVSARPAAQVGDVAVFHDLLRETARRKGFGIRPQAYFEAVYRHFNEPGRGILVFGEKDGQILAAAWAVSFGPEAIYLYAGSRSEGREASAAYLVLWEAIRWSIARGCLRFDFGGIPDAALSGRRTLQTMPRDQLSEGLWGVYLFKKGFRGRPVRTVGAYDLPYRPLLYRLYRLVGM